MAAADKFRIVNRGSSRAVSRKRDKIILNIYPIHFTKSFAQLQCKHPVTASHIQQPPAGLKLTESP